ncbi:MAG TPA: DNA-3-methyladenine glycosylase I [Propionibacteriaceae bacterium]|nr:DNA-3-methyladenine glycosylase I [Propionibacteriaceae bacterium]
MTAVPGPDGQLRCPWSLSAPEYLDYHDREWGQPVTSVSGLYERMTLEAFQSGLSWITILRKRDNFRAAFDQFLPERVALYDETDVDRLLSDAGIVRNLAKIDAAIANARVIATWGQGFAELVWSYYEADHRRPRTLADVPATSPASIALSRQLKKRGIRFLGPTTTYATMQAVGLVNDHLVNCCVLVPRLT